MQLQQEPKGWTEADIDHLLGTVDDILVDTGNIEQLLSNQEYLQQSILSVTIVMITAIYALVFLASIRIGWSISPYFLPTPKDLAP